MIARERENEKNVGSTRKLFLLESFGSACLHEDTSEPSVYRYLSHWLWTNSGLIRVTLCFTAVPISPLGSGLSLLTSLLKFCLSKQLWSQPPTLRGHPISKELSPFEISAAVAICAQLSLSTLPFSFPGSVHKDSVHALRTDSPTVAHAVPWNCLHGKNGNIFLNKLAN